VALLAQIGLKRIADVLDLPRAPLAARFGTILIRRIDQALGCEEESIVPLRPVPSYMAERRFADPIGREEDVLGTIGYLAHELSRALERQGEGARLVEAALFRADGQVKRVAAGTSEAVRDPLRLRRVFAERFAALADEYDPGFGFDMIRLSALTTERLDPAQTGLDHPDDGKDLAHLIDRLSARLGAERVMRLVPQDTHIPEFAMVKTPANLRLEEGLHRHPEARGAIASRLEGRRSSFEGRLRRSPQDDDGQDSLVPIRPLRLFERPEPIDAIAEVPDGPPVRFRWRRVLHQVKETEGPERIAMEWWRDDRGNMLTRDYFRIETRDGARFWLYRQGLFGGEEDRPGWFLHGLFA
jgi:protein ImuB